MLQFVTFKLTCLNSAADIDYGNLRSKTSLDASLVIMKEPEPQPPEQSASKLEKAVEQLSISSEQLPIQSIEKKLSQLEEQFKRSAEYALQKNADLYQRLDLS